MVLISDMNLEETLPTSLEKLQISDISQQPRCVSSLNPFGRIDFDGSSSSPESVFRSLSLTGEACPSGSCSCNKKKKSQGSALLHKIHFKRPVLQKSRLGPVSRRILRPPVLRLKETMTLMRPVDPPAALTSHLASLDLSTTAGKVLALDSRAVSDFRSLVSVNVPRLNLKSLSCFDTVSFIELRTKRDKHLFVGLRGPRRRTYSDSTALAVPTATSAADTEQTQRPQASCSVQARMTSSDDTNIDELASYFDLFVHIPKKMSHMAEMMYI